jgi:hypothetical protein
MLGETGKAMLQESQIKAILSDKKHQGLLMNYQGAVRLPDASYSFFREIAVSLAPAM